MLALALQIASPVAAVAQEAGVEFLCGIGPTEDLAPLKGTPWLVVSNFGPDVMSGMPPTRYKFGPLQAVHSGTREIRRLYPTPETAYDWDKKTFPDCPGPPESISSHGLGVRALGGDKFRLYSVNHTPDRHSVEVIDVAVSSKALETTWRGCVIASVDDLKVWPNGVTPLPGEGFFISGYNVASWRPRRGWERFSSFEGRTPGQSGGPGYANGVEVSPDGKWLYVADGYRHSVFRFPIDGGPPVIVQLVDGPDIKDYHAPDNLRWGEDGRLYATGPIFPKEWRGNLSEFSACFVKDLCVTGTYVAAIDPRTLSVEDIVKDFDGFKGKHGLTATAFQKGGELWMTSERSDCLAIAKLPAGARK